MVYRINRVGLGLSSDAQRGLSTTVRRRTLAILGYSGADRDVIDVINAARPRRVLWLARDLQDLAHRNSRTLTCQSILVGVGDLRTLFNI